jgi:hypothetical protein
MGEQEPPFSLGACSSGVCFIVPVYLVSKAYTRTGPYFADVIMINVMHTLVS